MEIKAMQKVEHVIVNYIESDKIETQGKRQEIQKYLDNGYYIKEDRNGYWVLVRTAKVQVTLTNSYGTKTFNVKDAILRYYGRERITDKLVNQFESDINSGKIIFEMSQSLSEWNMR